MALTPEQLKQMQALQKQTVVSFGSGLKNNLPPIEDAIANIEKKPLFSETADDLRQIMSGSRNVIEGRQENIREIEETFESGEQGGLRTRFQQFKRRRVPR